MKRKYIPIRCPICEGHGNVVGGYYIISPDVKTWTSSSSQETCRNCNGSGVVTCVEEEG